MALKQCKECNNTVSNQAKTCPHCGAKVKKSSWGLVCVIILVVGLFLLLPNIIIPKFIGRQVGGFFGVDNAHVKNQVEDVKLVTRSHLEEEYGNECVSLDLGERAKNDFAGEARLADGRELFVTAKIEGELISFTSQIKAGYAYKCKHHIAQLKLLVSPEDEERGVLLGEVWNDGSEPIRGFVVAEFIDDGGRVYQRYRGTVPFPLGGGGKPFDWVPPGKEAAFMYPASAEMLSGNVVNIRLEFFNLADEPLASTGYELFDKSVLDTIPVKVTSQTYKIQKEKANSETWEKIQNTFEAFRMMRAVISAQ